MKIGNVDIRVQQYADGRWGFDDYSRGSRKRVRLLTKAKAEDRASNAATRILRGRASDGEFESQPVASVIAEFKALKATKSARYRFSLTRDLALFEAFVGPRKPISEITARDIQRFLDSRRAGERRKFNLRAEIVSLFRYARRYSYVPDRTTEAEKVEQIAKRPGTPNVLSPDETRTLLANVRPDFLPWCATAAFAGIRSEEIAPYYKSKKSPLDWSDFDWRHRIIVVRAETSKTGEEREVPLLPNLAEWLTPYRRIRGPICDGRPTNYETGRLGKLIGGWKHNALRDSFCSYRARITRNIAQVSYEMGNSIQMVKRSYHRRQAIAPARAYFKIRPSRSENVVTFQNVA